MWPHWKIMWGRLSDSDSQIRIISHWLHEYTSQCESAQISFPQVLVFPSTAGPSISFVSECIHITSSCVIAYAKVEEFVVLFKVIAPSSSSRERHRAAVMAFWILFPSDLVPWSASFSFPIPLHLLPSCKQDAFSPHPCLCWLLCTEEN